jgi:hypothetical protein
MSKPCKKPAEKRGKLSVLLDLEDGDDMLLRNVGISPNYMSLDPEDLILQDYTYL